MGGGLFDEFGLGGLRFGEVEAGDLEGVEEEGGAAGVDVVGGDALEDLADGKLDGGSVFGEGNFEGGAAGLAGGGGGGGGVGGGCGGEVRVLGWGGGSSRGLLRGGMGCRSGGRR